MDPNHEILFEPIDIGPKRLKNRFYQVPHGPGFGNERFRSRASYSATKAAGGWAAVNTGLCLVSPDSDIVPVGVDRLWTREDAATMIPLCEGIHAHGALAGVELGHAGNDASSRGSRWPIIAPTQFASELHPRRVPKAMEVGDIERVQADWVHAARLARDAGFDIVYVYGGHSHLPTQFLSPFYNQRSDDYGGPFHNRARFWLETIAAVRHAVGSDCAIAVRIGVHALGLQLAEALSFIRAADAMVDLWDVNIGGIAEWWRDSGSSRYFAEGSQLEWTGHVRDATSKPIVGVGRLTNPDRMAEIVRSGVWDLIGAARPSIADPFIPEKVRAGRSDDIRECIGCNICIAMSQNNYVSCTQNATAGEEYRRGWHPEVCPAVATPDRDVLVIGAGPAGMECALVLARRGMRTVRLVDEHDDMGGHLRWVVDVPGLAAWRQVVEWRRAQLAKLATVEFTGGRNLSAREVAECGADCIVVATGSRWAADGLNAHTHAPLPGHDRPTVVTPETILQNGHRPTGKTVVVYDAEGYYMGAGIAELLAPTNHVHLVTSLPEVAQFCDETLEGELLRADLHRLGVVFHRKVIVQGIADSHVTAVNEFGEPVHFDYDEVVLITQRVSNDLLYHELKANRDANPESPPVYRVGDCVTPRLIADVVFDGHRLAMEIDHPEPAIPAPYKHDMSAVG